MKCYEVAALVLLSTLSPLGHAKDHSNDYKMGTLSKVPLHVGGKVSQGFTDTTSCNSGLLGVHCTGGIVDDYSGWLVADMPDGTETVIERCAGGMSVAALLLPCNKPYILTLTEEDGTFIFLDKVWGSRDSSKGLEITSKVLYRIEHKPGVTYVKIPDPADPTKEGSYTPIKLPKIETKETTPTAPDNVAAMCASGKLSKELQAKYCSQPNPTATK
ncbi:MAG TPA: hypothetical protein VGT08_21725 [Terracidiphilus sp.]|nr:hypothetical protein [Terracidiphilus sp.]